MISRIFFSCCFLLTCFRDGAANIIQFEDLEVPILTLVRVNTFIFGDSASKDFEKALEHAVTSYKLDVTPIRTQNN